MIEHPNTIYPLKYYLLMGVATFSRTSVLSERKNGFCFPVVHQWLFSDVVPVRIRPKYILQFGEIWLIL